MIRQSSCDGTRVFEAARRVSLAAKAGAVAVLSLGLFASSLYTNEARAIDVAPLIENATLVFSDTMVTTNLNAQLCAHNYSKEKVTVVFAFGVDGTTTLPQLTESIDPNSHICADFVSPVDLDGVTVRGAIVLQSPAVCSQATEYPGQCRVVGSLDFYPNNLSSSSPPIRHFEPVLVPALHNPQFLPTLPR